MMWTCSACVRARPLAPGGVSGRKTSLHRRGTHAGNTHKHGDNGKKSVYAVQLSASPTVLHTHAVQLLGPPRLATLDQIATNELNTPPGCCGPNNATGISASAR